MASKSKNIDMIHGPLGYKIFRFALPLALTGILQQMFNAADVMILGRFCGKEAMAAVGSNSPIIGLFLNLFIGISLGANVIIARLTGSGHTEEAKKAVHTAVIMAPLFGIMITIVGEIIADPLLSAMNVPENVFPMAIAYLRIYFLGMPVILLYNFESAVFRSQGNTKTPLMCLVAAGCLNVAGNLFFVLIMDMTADGVALATVISNVFSSLLMLFLLKRSKGITELERKYARIDRNLLGQILKIGVPAGVQSMVFSLSNIVIQSAINSLGSDIMAASSAAFNVEIVVYFVVNAFGQACTTFTSQNFGAGRIDRCRMTMKIVFIQDMIATAFMMAIVLLSGHELLSFFNSDPVVIKYGYIRLMYITGSEFLSTLMETFSGAMRGYGHSLEPAILTVIGVVGVRIIWVYTAFAVSPHFDTLLACYPLSWGVSALLLALCYLRLRKKVVSEAGVAAVSTD